MELKKVLEVQSYSYECWRMFAFIIRQAKANGWDYKVDAYKNIYITKGVADVYPCMVAHMDTVHSIKDDLTVLQIGDCLTGFDRTTMTQSGIGGDDKVGVWIALSFLEYFEFGKAAFFIDEEVGCHGSYQADIDFFLDCSMVLQCDRRGNTDFVTDASNVELSSEEYQYAVEPILKRYGYKFSNGMMTDVMALKSIGLPCCCANISCGYYNPHEDNEYVVITHAEACRDMCFDILRELGDEVWAHVDVDYEYSREDDYDDYDDLKTASKGLVSKPVYWESSSTDDNSAYCGGCTMVMDVRDITYDETYGALCPDCTDLLVNY